MANSFESSIVLTDTMPADQAMAIIYLHLLEQIKANQAGVIAGSDIECLHDFRVAIRKTRSGLTQLKAALPEEITAYYRNYFAWLGQQTNACRDLDVYLTNFNDYKAALPLTMRDDLDPLQALLQTKQALAQQQLAELLNSTSYLEPLQQWELYLQQLLQRPEKKETVLPVKTLANKRIWKVYLKVINCGLAINVNSSADELHELRKLCKKLRYLIEFFQSLYPAKKIKIIIKILKNLQECLGDLQNLAVQEQALQQFKTEIPLNKNSSSTFLAIKTLVEILATKRAQNRSDFAWNFAIFNQYDLQQLFRSLFSDD